MKIELKSIIYRLLAYIIVMSVFALIVHGIVFIDNKFDEKYQNQIEENQCINEKHYYQNGYCIYCGHKK